MTRVPSGEKKKGSTQLGINLHPVHAAVKILTQVRKWSADKQRHLRRGGRDLTKVSVPGGRHCSSVKASALERIDQHNKENAGSTAQKSILENKKKKEGRIYIFSPSSQRVKKKEWSEVD